MKTNGFLRSFGPLLVITLMLGAFASVYVILGIRMSDLAYVVYTCTLPIAFVRWGELDARRNKRTPCCDFGMLLLLVWPVTVPGYLLWTRGFRGLWIAGFFLAMLLTPTIAADFVLLRYVNFIMLTGAATIPAV